MAEGVGFEPTFARAKTVFKTVTINRSVTPPMQAKYTIRSVEPPHAASDGV